MSLFLVICVAVGCGGGGGSGASPGTGPSRNACDDLGLATRTFRIINGSACANLSQSAVIRILLLSSSGTISGFCTGTMLTSGIALTAAHCLDNNPSSVAISSGDPGNTTLVSVSRVRVHPAYQSSSTGAVNDVALLFLERALSVPTLPLLRSSNVQAGDIVGIFGYGTDENGNFDGLELKSGEMEVGDVSTDHIDADYSGEGSNTCTGDSGGPLTLTVNGVTAIVGVTSTGRRKDCGVGDFSRFANLQSQAVVAFLDRFAPGAGKL